MTLLVVFLSIIGIVFSLLLVSRNKRKVLEATISKELSMSSRTILEKKILFYSQLEESDKTLFEKRVQRFITTKNIEGVDTEIDDEIRIMVACSAIIPTFAFPEYNYPNTHTVLIYPNSFDERFQTERYEGHSEFIIGMVGNRALKSTVILSKPDLISAFSGLPNKSNVGIHEFVHLLDGEDGEIDGIPELLISHQYVGPWLHEIKNEVKKIETGTSDISPYSLSNNAEFLAVVSEYFFDNPNKFHKRHPELYQFLCTIFHQDVDKKS